MQKNIYIVIGEGRCGKSSLVRALTGVFRRSKHARRIRQTDRKVIHIHVWPQSAQEARLSPEDVLNDVNNAWSENIFLVLRFQPHIVPYYATDYVNLLSEHHNIVHTVFMGPGDNVQSIPSTGVSKTLDNCMKNPINENASRVREWWGWV